LIEFIPNGLLTSILYNDVVIDCLIRRWYVPPL